MLLALMVISYKSIRKCLVDDSTPPRPPSPHSIINLPFASIPIGMPPATILTFMALEATVTTTVLLNEIAILTSPWIILPSKPPNLANAASAPSPAWMALAYAVSEALWSTFWTALDIGEPWIMVMNLPPQHLWATELTLVALRHVLRDRSQTVTSLPSSTKDSMEGISPSPDQSTNSTPSISVFFIWALPLQVVAATNSSLTSLMEEMHRDPEKYHAPVLLWLTWLGMTIYLGCRFADFRICRGTFKSIPWSHCSMDVCSSALPYVLLLFICKTAMRILLGQQNPFMVFTRYDQPPVAPLWAVNGMNWLRSVEASMPTMPYQIPAPVRWIISIAGLCMARHFLNREDGA